MYFPLIQFHVDGRFSVFQMKVFYQRNSLNPSGVTDTVISYQEKYFFFIWATVIGNWIFAPNFVNKKFRLLNYLLFLFWIVSDKCNYPIYFWKVLCFVRDWLNSIQHYSMCSFRLNQKIYYYTFIEKTALNYGSANSDR